MQLFWQNVVFSISRLVILPYLTGHSQMIYRTPLGDRNRSYTPAITKSRWYQHFPLHMYSKLTPTSGGSWCLGRGFSLFSGGKYGRDGVVGVYMELRLIGHSQMVYRTCLYDRNRSYTPATPKSRLLKFWFFRHPPKFWYSLTTAN